MKTSYIVVSVVIVCVIGIFYARAARVEEIKNQPLSPLDTFAQCLGEAGATFYGAYWCPHCQDQKKLFNNSKKLPYVECSSPNGQTQLPVCIDKEIKSYPTWIFANGERFEGNQTLEELATKTNCTLPEEV